MAENNVEDANNGNTSTKAESNVNRNDSDIAESSQPKKVRRRAGPFKRSRTGCGTCKRRGKKCDEEWNEEGFCQRCMMGQFECTGRTEQAIKESSSKNGGVLKEISGGMRSSSSSDRSPNEPSDIHTHNHNQNQNQLHQQQSNILNPPPPPLSGQGMNSVPSIPTFDVSPPTTSSITGHPVTSNPLLQSQPQPTFDSNGNLNLPNTFGFWGTPTTPAINPNHHHHHHQSHVHNMDINFPIDPLDFFPSLPNVQPSNVYNWQSQFGLTNSAIPSTSITNPLTNTTGMTNNNINNNNDIINQLSIDQPFSWNLNSNNQQTNDLWNEIAASFMTTPNVDILHKPQNSTHQSNSNSRIIFYNSEKPTRQGVSLAEIYARVVESWLVGIPSGTRDYARARILALNDSNSVMRNVRFAVSAAYIFLFAGCSERSAAANPNNPQPKLVELACKGAGFVDGKSTTLSQTGEGSDILSPMSKDGIEKEHLNSALQKIRIYVDYVATPFAADMESLKWTEDAVRELKEITVTEKSQLSDLLWGVIDLQLVEFIRGGAAPSYNMLALGDKLVRSAMGSNHPPITLSSLRTLETFSLRHYALSDIGRCIVQRGRKTIFNFWSDVNDNQGNTPTATDDGEPWAAYLGLPDSIVILLAEVVNLCADLTSSSLSSIKAQADELESALKNWSPISSNSVSLDSTAMISRTIAGELWRLSALILLYESVHRVGGLHPILRRGQSEILNLLDSISRLPNGDLWGFIGLPAFLAASLSITELDRQRSLTHLARPGPERVWLDNIALVEKIWQETDETGKLPDWHDKMTREGMLVAFF